MSEVDSERPIVMPKLGLTMSEGLISQWCVSPGDTVRVGQMLFVVETDKISNEIDASADGTIIELLVKEGETVGVGVPVATWIAAAQGSVSPPEAVMAPTAAAARVETLPSARTSKDQRRLSTPIARRQAQQGGIDITMITGSGPRGRIKACDVQAALAKNTAKPNQTFAPTPSSSPGRGRDLRSLIAARVSRSKAEIPHFYVDADARFDALAALRRELNVDPMAPLKLSVTAFLGAAVARAMALRPEANVVWRDNQVLTLQSRAIGIAVETPGGVMAPVVPFSSGIYDFAAALDAAIERARNRRLGAGDLGEAAIGISNVGMFGVRALTPIIDPDQSFMLGVGAPHTSFRVDEGGAPKAVQQVTLSLACDHRAIDGAAAARFLATIVEQIEHPMRLLIPPVDVSSPFADRE